MCWKKLDLPQKRPLLRRGLYALPAGQQKLFFDDVLDWCRRIAGPDRAEAILSELTHKLFGMSMRGEKIEIPVEVPRRAHGHLIRAWLLREAQSIPLRHVIIDDLRRNEDREGRLDQLKEGDDEVVQADEPSAPVELRLDRIWEGVLRAAEAEFDEDDNALVLLKYLATSPVEFRGQWPITEIANLLDQADPTRAWSVPAVNNAKAQIETWVVNLKRELGISWPLALQNARLLQNDVLPLLQFAIQNDMKTIPELDAAKTAGLVGWSRSRFQRTCETIASLRHTTGCDVAGLAGRISNSHLLAGPPMQLLKHINDDARLISQFRTGFEAARLVAILNGREGKPVWDVRKVQRAAQELNNWIGGVDGLGLEIYDIEDLFERIAQKSVGE
jgi:hypothetical protein